MRREIQIFVCNFLGFGRILIRVMNFLDLDSNDFNPDVWLSSQYYDHMSGKFSRPNLKDNVSAKYIRQNTCEGACEHSVFLSQSV